MLGENSTLTSAMNRTARLTTPVALSLAALAALIVFIVPVGGETDAEKEFEVLVFSKTEGFRHGSIPAGIEAIEELGREHGFAVEATEEAAVFTDENLAGYAAIVFLNTTGTLFDEDQRVALKGYIRSGGGYVGVHSAADTEYDWPWYGELVGAWFENHPPVQEAVIDVEDRDHPSTRHLPERWERRDEWYNYRRNPRDEVEVLLTLDPETFDGSGMEEDHPIAWCREFDGGRSWYTGGGHTEESYSEPEFREHLLGGIRWTAGKR